MATTVLVSGGLGLAGLGAGTAQARPARLTLVAIRAATAQITGAQGIPCIPIRVGRTTASIGT